MSEISQRELLQHIALQIGATGRNFYIIASDYQQGWSLKENITKSFSKAVQKVINPKIIIKTINCPDFDPVFNTIYGVEDERVYITPYAQSLVKRKKLIKEQSE